MSHNQIKDENVIDLEDNNTSTNIDNESTYTSDTILVNSTKTNYVSPADIHKCLSTYTSTQATNKSKPYPNE